MTITAGDDRDNEHHRTRARQHRGSNSPSENWDDDFEFHAGAVAGARDNAYDAMNAPTRPDLSFEQEESWDDAYEDDNTHSSPIKRSQKAVDEDVEDWDSSDNELEAQNELKHKSRSGKMQELGFGGFEEEDKTVTARSTSCKPREPLPALPLPIPPSHSTHHFHAHTVLPATSPTLSSFSIPLSSTTRDRTSIYSQDPLMPTSNSSAPHLSVIRSYPHAAGPTPPRKGRRLRKKSRPPEADIFELEDREPESGPAPILSTVNVPQIDVPSPTTPPSSQKTTPESSSWPSQPSAPPTPSSSLLTRIGSFKRWARRSMGPDDPALSGWRRGKSSTGPSEAKSSHVPGEVLALAPGRKSSTGPEVRSSMENNDEPDSRAVSPTPAPGNKARRSRGESASGLKSGWFFRTGGAAGSEKDDAPAVQTVELTPSKRTTTLGLRLRHKEPEEGEDEHGKTPTPRKSKGKLVPVLRMGGSGESYTQGEQKSPTRISKRPSSPEGTDSQLHNGPRPRSMLFPRQGTASIGRHAGLPVSASMSAGAALLTSTGESLERDGKVHGAGKEKDNGIRGLMNGVRRLSLVSTSHTHKRPKSIGGRDDTVEAVGNEIVTRPQSQITHYASPKLEQSALHIPFARLVPHQLEGNGLLPPVELESPGPGVFSRRGSLPWTDYDHFSAADSRTRDSFTGPAYRPPDVTEKDSQIRHSFSSGASSLHVESSEQPSASGSSTKPNISLPAPSTAPMPVPNALPDTAPRSLPLASTSPPDQCPILESRQTTPLQPLSQSQSTQPSTPQSASLGRSTASPSHSVGLRRNSLGDLKTPLNTLAEHKPQLPPLGELKIPARISRAQQGLRRDMGMVREFAGCVEQLKRLQVTYIALLGDLRDGYDTSFGSPTSNVAQVQFHLPSRPPSQIGNVGKAITSNSNSSVQHLFQNKCFNSPPLLHPARSFSRASHDISQELIRLEQEYGIWWECAELLVELGGGSGVATSSASNPNLVIHSTSTLNTPADDLLKPRSSEKQAMPRPITHVSSMSEPGSLFEQAIPTSSSSKGPPQASPPHPSQWRASTGRHDLSARQLRLLKDMLNTPDPASLAYAAGPYGYGAGYPYPHSRPQTAMEAQPWAAWNPSALTLPSEESSADAHGQDAIAGAEPRREGKEKKRRTSRLGMLGLRDLLRSLKRNAVAEGRLGTGDEPVHGSESSMSNGAEDDHYNRRRSPWHQHDEHHVIIQSAGPELKVAMDLPPSRNLPPKSPRRPSLASIFRIGNKNVKSACGNSKSKESSPIEYGNIATEDERVVGLAAGELGEYSDWQRMSRSDLDMAAIGSGTGTVRAKKTTKAAASHPNLNLNHPYSDFKVMTPKKTPATSQTSLWDSSPSSAASPQPSHLPLFIAEEDGGKNSRKAKAPKLVRSQERTSSWSQAHPLPRPTSRNGKATISGTVRSAPPSDLSSTTSEPKLALTPENIKPLLEYAKEVGTRLSECIGEVQILLGTGTKAS